MRKSGIISRGLLICERRSVVLMVVSKMRRYFRVVKWNIRTVPVVEELSADCLGDDLLIQAYSPTAPDTLKFYVVTKDESAELDIVTMLTGRPANSEARAGWWILSNAKASPLDPFSQSFLLEAIVKYDDCCRSSDGNVTD